MVCRRMKTAVIATRIGNHSFRAAGITTYLKNGGTLENAAAMFMAPPGQLDQQASLWIARLLLVAHGQQRHRLAVETIQDDIAAVSKVDELFPISGVHIFRWTADVRRYRQNLYSFPDHGDCALRCIGILGQQPAMEPINIIQCVRRPDQTWHLGGSAFSPASSFASQASASSSVTCKPVC